MNQMTPQELEVRKRRIARQKAEYAREDAAVKSALFAVTGRYGDQNDVDRFTARLHDLGFKISRER